MHRSDRELVDAACHGDIEAFRGLYERHFQTILAIARSLLHDSNLRLRNRSPLPVSSWPD